MAGIGFLGQVRFLFMIPVILLKLMGLSAFQVRNDRDSVKALMKVLDEETRSSSSVFEQGKLCPSGVFIGWRCFGYYSETQGTMCDAEIVVFTTTSNFKRMMDKNTVSNSISFEHTEKREFSNPQKITMWARSGPYKGIYYRPRTIDLGMIYPIGAQIPIVNSILTQYREKGRLTVFIHGVTGAGKSSIGLLVAKELNGSYCHDFNPTDPGDSFSNLIRDIETRGEEQKPIIVVIEEVNTMIRAVNRGQYERHKDITTQVNSKATFNTFLDDLVFEKNIILIMTSNEGKKEIDTLDPSYLRKGRVNAYYSMMKPLAA